MGSDSSILSDERAEPVKLDSKGLPLVPQPTASPIDPLNYPNWLKYMMLLELSFLSFASAFAGTLPTPAVREIARAFHVSTYTVVVPSIVPLVVGAVTALFLIPVANAYGHRLIFLLPTLVSLGFKFAAAQATSFVALTVFRSLSGISGVNNVIAIAAVSNLFYAHQMGRAMGIYIVLSHHGAHVGPIAGGFIATRMGWRWTFWFGAIILGVKFIMTVFLLPETLFQRPNIDYSFSDSRLKLGQSEIYQPPPLQLRTYLRCLRILDRERMPSRGIHWSDVCIRPFKMLRYPSVLIPAVCYAVVSTYSSVGPVAVAPAQFAEAFNFTSAQSGLATGLGVVIGTSIGELFSGTVTDYIMERSRKNALKGGRPVVPEIRLRGIWLGAIIVPLGLLMYGFTIHYSKSFLGPCIALAFTCIGSQIVTSVLYTYACGDCYPKQSGDISQIFNLLRSLFSLALPFYEDPLGKKLGYHFAFTIFAAICVLTFIGIGVLSVKGPEWRAKGPEMPED